MLKCLVLLVGLWGLEVFSGDFRARFESSEHTIAGDDVTLQGVKMPLRLSNGLKISFGEMVAMPDFYGVVDTPICEGQSESEREERFLNAFATLAEEPEAVDEVRSIIFNIKEQKRLTLEGMKAGREASEILDGEARERARRWNCITGGGCSQIAWWTIPGRYLLLAKKNYDHFGKNALLAYEAGHTLALKEAIEAGKTKNHTRLEKAYALHGFACHFLTDRFAAGHIRTPRVELPEHVTPSIVGSLLSGMMHNEECDHGLHVHNKQGERWMAYGDGHYLEPRNQDNRRIMKKALQVSTNAIYEAYKSGEMPSKYQELDYIPEPDESWLNAKQDVAQLFYWDADGERLMRRTALSDVYDYNWTSLWFGWSTLAELQALKGLEIEFSEPDSYYLEYIDIP